MAFPQRTVFSGTGCDLRGPLLAEQCTTAMPPDPCLPPPLPLRPSPVQGLGMTVDPDKPLVAVISRLVPQVPPPPSCLLPAQGGRALSASLAAVSRRAPCTSTSLPCALPALLCAPQKGIHLIEHAVHRTVEMGGQFVVLGTGHADGGLRGLAGGQYRCGARRGPHAGAPRGVSTLLLERPCTGSGLPRSRALPAARHSTVHRSPAPPRVHSPAPPTPCLRASTFCPRVHHLCREHPDVQMRFMYSEPLAHQIYAAADMLLVPSMFEPCGLTQERRLPPCLPRLACVAAESAPPLRRQTCLGACLQLRGCAGGRWELSERSR